MDHTTTWSSLDAIKAAVAKYGTKNYEGILGNPRPDRTERVRKINERINKAQPLHLKSLAEVMKEIEADAALPEPTVCLFFEGHKDLTPEQFEFHRIKCAYKYVNQLHRAKLPRDTIQCIYCFQPFLPPEAEYHHKRCDKKRAAWIEQAKKNEKLAKLNAEKKACIKASKSGEGPASTSKPVAEDEDWDAGEVPGGSIGRPVSGYNPALKVASSAVMVTPMGMTKSERRKHIKKRVPLFIQKNNVMGEEDWT